MQALRAINRPSVITSEHPQQHRVIDSPPLITPGKYRPLEYPEIYAAVKESTPLYDDSVGSLEDGLAFTNHTLAVARHYYGPNVHILTKDMALQFAGRPVYFIDSAFSQIYNSRHSGDPYDRKELINVYLSLGLFSKGSLYEPYFGEPRDTVTCYTYDKDLLESENIPRSIDPYCAPERVLSIDRSGIVMDEWWQFCFYVLAEKLD